MEKFTLNKLWELRAELDNAIFAKEYDKISEIKAKYEAMIEGEKGFNRMFVAYNHAFTDADSRKHVASNMQAISKNIEAYERKYLKGEDVSLKINMPKGEFFLAGEIWLIRTMYDKFYAQGSQMDQEAWSLQRNMIRGQVIQDRLTELLKMDKLDEHNIMPMLKEVQAGYEKIYGKDKPKINYSQLAEEECVNK